MQIMPKTGAFEAIVLSLSEQSQRHQSAIARFADRALTETALDPILLEACQLCIDVLEVPAARVLECLDESGLAQRCIARRDGQAEKPRPWYGNTPPLRRGGGGLPAGLGLMPGTVQPRMLSSVSVLISDGEERFGLLELDRAYARDFSELEVEFIAAIARLLGRAVARNRDLEAMRLANEVLAVQVDEARTLLHELSYRIQSDLRVLEDQAIQAQQTARDPGSRQALSDIGRRVISMANLYEHLLAKPEQQMVAFDDYLSTLCIGVQNAQDLTARGIMLQVTAEPVRLEREHAVAFGIAANELINNALAHAFRSGEGGRIKLRLATEGDGRLRASLTIADDGSGIPESAVHSDGLISVRRLVAQHGGRLGCETGDGTTWTISFPCV
jgi:two-component sensor histidine kinase